MRLKPRNHYCNATAKRAGRQIIESGRIAAVVEINQVGIPRRLTYAPLGGWLRSGVATRRDHILQQGIGPMKTRAAVAFEAKRPLEIVELDLDGPRAGEVLVEIMATGICHTDAYTLDGFDSEGCSRRARP